jgi:hypothetical protein
MAEAIILFPSPTTSAIITPQNLFILSIPKLIASSWY